MDHPLYGIVEHCVKKKIFLFLNSDAVLSDSTLENKISERFRFVVIQKFCYHGNVT